MNSSRFDERGLIPEPDGSWDQAIDQYTSDATKQFAAAMEADMVATMTDIATSDVLEPLKNCGNKILFRHKVPP